MDTAADEGANPRALSVLVAEDNPDDIFFLEEAFRKAAVPGALRWARDGVEAVQYLKAEGPFADRQANPVPDVLLLDVNMPRMNGFEVLEWIRSDKIFGQLIVHILTASCRPGDVRRAYELRANSYVVKPSRLNELVAFAAALRDWHRFVLPSVHLADYPKLGRHSDLCL